MSTRDWLKALIAAERKPAIPILSFPCVSLMGVCVRELVGSSELQARGMKLVSDRVPSGASVSMMDLSVEAEAFGSAIRFDDREVPAVTGILVRDEAGALELEVPRVGAGRTGRYVEAIEKAARLIDDRPVFAGMIGPFSLAGRLLGVSEALLMCYDEAELVHLVIEKSARFLIEYARAYKAVGAAGVVMAEPLAGLLSPALAGEVSHPYGKRIIDAVQEDDFCVIYHNCGDSAAKMVDGLVRMGAAAYHFGNKANLAQVLPQMPKDVPAMGNIDPAGQFRSGTPQSVAEETRRLLDECGRYGNFILSSGCDIPPATPWENIDAFFLAASEFYDLRASRAARGI